MPGSGKFVKNQGVNSMTWRTKAVKVVSLVSVLGALALATGANYVDFGLSFSGWGWGW